MRSFFLSNPRMRSLSAAFVLLLAAAVAGAYEPTSRYVIKDIEGWQVYVHRDLLAGGEHRETGTPALRQLKYGLAKTRQMVADGPLEKLQAVKIWLEVDSTNGKHGRTSAYQYHPDLDWLEEMDFHPKKQKCVEFGNAAGLAKRSDLKTVQVTMHELAHAYHDQVLTFDDPDVLAAHKRAREEKKYPPKDWVVRADHKEFFAGLTTRYFESEERRKEIVERDPVFAKKLEQYWGKPKALFDTPLDDLKQNAPNKPHVNDDRRELDPDSAVATIEYISGGVKHTRKVLDGEKASGTSTNIVEMLMQLHKNEILLLPALPKEWSGGRVKGLRAPGGFELDFAWQDGRLAELTIHSKDGKPCMVRYGDRGDTAFIKLEETKAGESYTFDDRFRFTIEDDAQRGRLHVKDMDKSILTYNYGMQLNTGVDEKYERGCYIHPLWDVNGWQRTITEDFPPLDGHLHHRGLGWVWPSVKVRGLQVQTWHPSNPPLRQHFVKWLKREADKNHATIAVENAWLLDDKEKVMTETVEIVMHPLRTITRVRDDKPNSRPWELDARAIDLKLTFEAVGGPIELSGGYGGLLLRGSADMKDGVITTEEGPLDGDSGGRACKWADLTHKGRGVAIFTPADHPPHPQNSRKADRPSTPPRWLLRTSYAGLMNVSWPGPRPVTLEPGQPLTLAYRIYVHEGDAEAAQVAKAYADYIEQQK